MITPFTDDGALDVDGAVKLAKWLESEGVEGLVITGTTGEGPTVTDEEDWELWAAVCEAATVPVVVGPTTNDTAHSVTQTRRAAELGADGILAVTPYYNRPSQAGIRGHFAAIAECTELPIILYDIPVRTGRKISTDLILDLAQSYSNILGLKDAAADPGETASVVANAPAGFEVYSGDDSLTLPLMAVGAVGVITVAGHWCAPDLIEMFDRWDKGDIEGARATNARMLESFAFETGDLAPNPVPTKAMLRTLDLPSGEPRLPMGPTPAGLEDQAREVYANLIAQR